MIGVAKFLGGVMGIIGGAMMVLGNDAPVAQILLVCGMAIMVPAAIVELRRNRREGHEPE